MRIKSIHISEQQTFKALKEERYVHSKCVESTSM